MDVSGGMGESDEAVPAGDTEAAEVATERIADRRNRPLTFASQGPFSWYSDKLR